MIHCKAIACIWLLRLLLNKQLLMLIRKLGDAALENVTNTLVFGDGTETSPLTKWCSRGYQWKMVKFEVVTRNLCRLQTTWKKWGKKPTIFEWKASHIANRNGSANSMECEEAKRIWGRPIFKNNLIYTDSATLNSIVMGIEKAIHGSCSEEGWLVAV